MKAPELPLLRQMVLENTERIDRNEKSINLIRMENNRQNKKIDDFDQRMRNFHEEFGESMRRSAERMDRIEKFAETSRIEYETRNQELNEHLKESSTDFDRRMKESNEKFEREMRERDEKFKIEMRERDEKFDRWMKERDEKFRIEMRERDEKFKIEMRERDEKFDREMKEHDEKFEKEMKERDEKFEKAMEKSRAENEKQNKELKESIAKTNAETNASINASIRRISVEFLGVTGHMVEGLVGSSAEKIFQNAGFDLHNKGKNLKSVLAPGNRQMEIDAVLGNENMIVPIEVKEHFTKKKVKRWLQKMESFRDFFPEYAGKEVIAAIAAINYEAGADAFAHEEGLLVVRVSSDDIFTLAPVDKNKLRKF